MCNFGIHVGHYEKHLCEILYLDQRFRGRSFLAAILLILFVHFYQIFFKFHKCLVDLPVTKMTSLLNLQTVQDGYKLRLS